MKIIITISILFIFTLVSAQENKKTNTETITVSKEKQANQYALYYKTYTGIATISKKEILEMDTLKVGPQLSKRTHFITSFQITLLVKGVMKTTMNKGNVLSNESLKMLQEVSLGSKIFIDNVKAVLTDGVERSIPGMTIKVK